MYFKHCCCQEDTTYISEIQCIRHFTEGNRKRFGDWPICRVLNSNAKNDSSIMKQIDLNPDLIGAERKEQVKSPDSVHLFADTAVSGVLVMWRGLADSPVIRMLMQILRRCWKTRLILCKITGTGKSRPLWSP